MDNGQLPVGTTYLASFHAVVTTASPAAECRVENGGATQFPLLTNFTATTGPAPALNGTGPVTVGPNDAFQLRCIVGAAWSAAYPAHLTLTPVASVTSGNLLTLP